jgi:hypothetical protein
VINKLFTFSSTIERLRQGPLNEHLDAYAAAVADQGYTDHSIRQQIVVIADFSRWLSENTARSALGRVLLDGLLALLTERKRSCNIIATGCAFHRSSSHEEIEREKDDKQ